MIKRLIVLWSIILIFVTMPIVAKECGRCDGKISNLTLQYNGDKSALVEVYGHKGDTVFKGTVDKYAFFLLNGFDKKNTLGPKVKVYVDGKFNTEIHTSCSVELLVGMEFGVFTIRDGSSRNGGEICTTSKYVDVGHLCGAIFEDKNENGTQDNGEVGVANIALDVSNGDFTKRVQTDANGAYCVYTVPIGDTSVLIDESTLPFGSSLRVGKNPSTTFVMPNETNDAGLDGYSFNNLIAFDQNITLLENSSKPIILKGEGGNLPLNYQIIAQPTHGVLSDTLPNVTYTPSKDYSGLDSFTFKVENGVGESNIATVNITIIPVNNRPVAVDDSVTINEDENISIDVLANDRDSDNNQSDFTITITQNPSHGEVTLVDGKVLYVPHEDYNGNDSFRYKINDGVEDSNEANVTITILPLKKLDCSEDEFEEGQFNPKVKFEWDWKNATYSSSNQVMSSPIVGQLTDDNGDGKIDNEDTPDIIFTSFSGYNYQSNGVLRAISGDDGDEILAIQGVSPYHAPALGDIDNDGLIEIVVGVSSSRGLKVFENNGDLKWSISTNGSSEIALTDLDNNGEVEIIYGGGVYDTSGKHLSSFSASRVPITVDVNDDNISEIISNGKAYGLNGEVLWDSGYEGRHSAVGNFDNDKYPEIAMIYSSGYRENSLILVNHDGTLQWGSVEIPGGGGGPITISDVDADNEVEIGIAGANYYVVYETDGTLKWQSKTKDHSSRITGSTVFDFEGDGKSEILYNDEAYFRIYSGETGEVLFDKNNTSGTLWEYPIVVDVDNDSHAEIVVVSNNYAFREPDRVGGFTGIMVLEDANDSWMPTRSIWNQHSYHITNINDDGTIPRVEEPSWLTHNTYRLNTFRVESKCQVAPKAYSDKITTLENTAKNIKLFGTDRNNDTLTYHITQQPQHGTLIADGIYITYVPNDGYVGDDNFAYKVNDGLADSNEASITIQVLSAENALVANDDIVITQEDTNTTIDVLSNDSNTTGAISIAIVIPPKEGTAVVQNGKVIYTPNGDYFGEDSFFYAYRNSNDFISNSAKVTITVQNSNDRPVAYDQNISILEDTEKVITLEASDNESSDLTFTIVEPPKNGTLNGVAPYFAYIPNKDFFGVDSFSFTASDQNATSQSATVTITVQAINDVPIAVAGQDFDVTFGQQVKLDASQSYDSDGTIVHYVWRENNVTKAESQEVNISTLEVGRHKFILTVTDNDGLTNSDTVIVNVIDESTPDTLPPIITVLGDNPHILAIGEGYSDAGATAWDNRDGNLSVGVSYSFNSGVEGTYKVTYTAIDSSGNRAEAYRNVMVVNQTTPDTTPPVITLLGDNPLIVFQDTIFTDPGVSILDDHDGTAVGYSMSHNVNTAQLGTYSVQYIATDRAGNSSVATRTVYVKDPAGNRNPIANAGADVVISLDENVTFDASGSSDADGAIISYLWQEGSVILSRDKTFTKNGFTFGSHTITLLVTDNEGATASDTVTVRVIDPSDVTPPTAIINTPLESNEVLIKESIVGTASDDNLDYYELLISPVGQGNYTPLLKETLSVTNGTLGEIDATTLRNGVYDILLKAVDRNGAVATDKTTIIIKGKAKIGNFSFTVTDFDLQVGGLPVQVNRTYSTLQRMEKLDFTYGWSIDYQNVKLEESIHPGKEWKMTPDTLVGSCFKTDKQHRVNIAMPDGSTEAFEFKFERECGHYFAGSFYDAPKLYALNGSEATLEVIDAADTVAMYSDGTIIDGVSLKPYNPSKYRLTLSNGMVYEVLQGQGLTKVKDLRGDTLTYNENGIISSRGESLTFERDSQNRITKITDLTGKQVSYHYDQDDNLAYVIDQLGQKTEYRYQEGHLLEEYFDPSGLRLTKNYYDASGRLIKTEDPDGNIIEFTHDIDGREELVKDKLGRTSLFVYDEEGNVLSQTNPMGETTTYTYDSQGNVLSTTDALGNIVTNTYDNSGNLLSTTDALGNTETTTYNSYGSPLTISDKNGNSMSIVYNAYNSPRSITTASGATNTYYYDQYGNKIQSINEYNQTTNYEYDEHYITLIGGVSSKGNLLKETQPNGTVIEHTYDESSNLLTTTKTYTKPDGTQATTISSNSYDVFNRVVSTTDELGNITTYKYDARGNKVEETDSQGRVTKYEYTPTNKITKVIYSDGTFESKTYDAMDNLLSETNQEGETTSYEYDGADRLVKTTYPDNSTTSTEYDEAGRVVSTTDENGNSTTYTYDAVGNKISQTDALNNTTTYTYDTQGNMLTVTDALNHTISYSYSESNNRIKTTYHNNSTDSTTYDISGRMLSSTDQKEVTTNFGYDQWGNLEKVTNALGYETRYSYDNLGNKVLHSDAKEQITTWVYDNYGRKIKEILPLGQERLYSYDEYGRVSTQTDFKGQKTTYSYNIMGRVGKVSYDDGSYKEITYDKVGRRVLVTMVSNSKRETTKYSYDQRGRLAKEEQADGSTLEYTYDNVGNKTLLSITKGGETIQTTYSYDHLNRLKSVTSNSGEVTTYNYDVVGNRTSVVHHNQNETEYRYDALNQLVKLEHKNSSGDSLAYFNYTLDAIGQRTKIEEPNKTTSYTYDKLNRLTSESIIDSVNGDYEASYLYDKVGNRIESTIDGITTQYSYDANNRLTKQGGIEFEYDENGNLLTQSVDYNKTNYSYNAQNQLVKMESPSETVTYAYNSEGIRIAKVTNNETINYTIDSNQLYAQVVQEYVDDNLKVNYTYGDDLISQNRDNTIHIYHYDGQGSARYLSDVNGEFTDSYNYEAFGKLLSQTGDTENNYRYTGEQYDQESDNYYLRARYYTPTTGRFTQMDSYEGRVGEPITLHKYLYANANPSNMIDPSGYFSIGSVAMATNIKASLQNLQIGTYSNVLDMAMSGGDASFDSIPAIAGTSVGLKLLLRFSPKLKKACRNSFDGETLISTENGLVPIQDIKIGDKVWAYNEENKTKSLQEVVHLIQGEGSKELVDIELKSGEIITTTHNHPLYSLRDNKWLDAGELGLHSILYNFDDSNSSIASLRSYTKDTTVYNLTVDNDHTYFVGTSGILGHNANCVKYPLPTDKTFRHIFNGDIDFQGNPSGIHHKSAIRQLSKNIHIVPIFTPHNRMGFYQAKVYLNRSKKARQSGMFPDSWDRRKIKKVIRKGYLKMLETDNNRVNLGDVLGDSYQNIILQYKYHRGTNELESVFPIIRPR